eukprot:85635-Heterocapsa_arctica.AAC.1
MGLTGSSKSSSSLDAKQPKGDDETVLNDDEREKYQSNTMRQIYLGLDKPEMQYDGKELRCACRSPRGGTTSS